MPSPKITVNLTDQEIQAISHLGYDLRMAGELAVEYWHNLPLDERVALLSRPKTCKCQQRTCRLSLDAYELLDGYIPTRGHIASTAISIWLTTNPDRTPLVVSPALAARLRRIGGDTDWHLGNAISLYLENF